MLKPLLAYGLWIRFWNNKVFTGTLKKGKGTKKLSFCIKVAVSRDFRLQVFSRIVFPWEPDNSYSAISNLLILKIRKDIHN